MLFCLNPTWKKTFALIYKKFQCFVLQWNFGYVRCNKASVNQYVVSHLAYMLEDITNTTSKKNATHHCKMKWYHKNDITDIKMKTSSFDNKFQDFLWIKTDLNFYEYQSCIQSLFHLFLWELINLTHTSKNIAKVWYHWLSVQK